MLMQVFPCGPSSGRIVLLYVSTLRLLPLPFLPDAHSTTYSRTRSTAISTGAMICLLVYVRKLMVRLHNSDAKRESNYRNTGDEMRQLTSMIADLQAHLGSTGSLNGQMGSSMGGSRRGSWSGGPNNTPTGFLSDEMIGLSAGGSTGGLSDSGYSSTGYSSGEDLTSEEHLSTARRTIKRTLSNSSIQSMRQNLCNSTVRDSLSKNDLDSLMFMFGDTEDGVSC
jgi:hypothetical protein